MRPTTIAWLVMFSGALVIASCIDGGTQAVSDAGDASDTTEAPPPSPHRATAETCDDARAYPAVYEDASAAMLGCTSHEECDQGANGRCTGNSHDGWQCTYDRCFEDSECGGFVCQCAGGFRADNNICLREGNCLTDADCGAGGFCSPTLGDCGNYAGIVGYYCRTAADECAEDADCEVDGGAGYCAYNKVAGKWKCSTQQCAG